MTTLQIARQINDIAARWPDIEIVDIRRVDREDYVEFELVTEGGLRTTITPRFGIKPLKKE